MIYLYSCRVVIQAIKNLGGSIKMNSSDLIIIIMLFVAVIGGGLYLLNKKLSKKMNDAQSFIETSKQLVTIYPIDKRKDKITNVNMPKAVLDQVPKYQRLIPNYFVKAKVGPQIVTLMCDKHVFNAVPVKKNIKVELAGIYIVSVVGMKSKEEMKQIKKDKKEKAKAEKKK